MPRPCKPRRVNCNPRAMSFKPCGAQRHAVDTVSLNLDELEAIRLADYEGMYQQQAAEKMRISRQTFGSIIASAHEKVADFLVNSKHLSVGGGTVEIDRCRFICGVCEHTWSIARGMGRPRECPKCGSANLDCLKRVSGEMNLNKCWRDS